MPRSDFAWVNFDHTFNAGSPSADRSFNVEGVPVPASLPDAPGNAQAVGYVLVQALDAEKPGATVSDHRIQINGVDLPSFDVPVEGGAWQTWMDRIPPNVLKGNSVNRITIIGSASDPDGFHVANVAVHWREQG